jgi:hypothetical protein
MTPTSTATLRPSDNDAVVAAPSMPTVERIDRSTESVRQTLATVPSLALTTLLSSVEQHIALRVWA